MTYQHTYYICKWTSGKNCEQDILTSMTYKLQVIDTVLKYNTYWLKSGTNIYWLMVQYMLCHL